MSSMTRPAAVTRQTSLRKIREERVQARKLRDRPPSVQQLNIDPEPLSLVPPAKPSSLVRPTNPPPLDLKALRPAPLKSSSPPPSSSSSLGQTGYTPSSAATQIALSPVMLVAEQLPLRKAVQMVKPARLVLPSRKSPAPRPRSAVKTAHMGTNLQTLRRSRSPEKTTLDIVLPSPPPKKDLPPTPTQSSSDASTSRQQSLEVTAEALSMPIKVLDHAVSSSPFPVPPSESWSKSALPTPPSEPSPGLTSPPAQPTDPPVRIGQAQPSQGQGSHGSSTTSSRKSSHMEARLDALERQNRLLEAALMAVLKTGGTMNGCP
ncbi:hypothetical protein LTR28_003050, partial [Elasticomyces elasticus]